MGFAPYGYVKLITLISHTDGYSAKDVHYEYRLILSLNLKTREFGRLKELLLNININYWQEPEILLLNYSENIHKEFVTAIFLITMKYFSI